MQEKEIHITIPPLLSREGARGWVENWTIIYYKTFGDEKSQDKILILHWWWGKSDSWIEVANSLSSQWFFVVVPDLPWFGKTEFPSVYTMDDYRDRIEEFTKKLELDTAWLTLIWHSNGWAISTKLSISKKIDIKNLILIGSAWIRNKKSTSLKRKIYNTLLFPAKIIKNLPGGSKLRNLFYKAIGWQDYLAAEQNPLLKKTFLNIIHTDLQEVFPKIDIKTSLIRWDSDTYTPLSDGSLIHSLIPKSTLTVLPWEKHWIHLQNPDLLVKTILKHI